MEQDTFATLARVFLARLGVTYSQPAETAPSEEEDDDALEYVEVDYNVCFSDGEEVRLVEVAINLEDPESELHKNIDWPELLGMTGIEIEVVEVLSIKILPGSTQIA